MLKGRGEDSWKGKLPKLKKFLFKIMRKNKYIKETVIPTLIIAFSNMDFSSTTLGGGMMLAQADGSAAAAYADILPTFLLITSVTSGALSATASFTGKELGKARKHIANVKHATKLVIKKIFENGEIEAISSTNITQIQQAINDAIKEIVNSGNRQSLMIKEELQTFLNNSAFNQEIIFLLGTLDNNIDLMQLMNPDIKIKEINKFVNKLGKEHYKSCGLILRQGEILSLFYSLASMPLIACIFLLYRALQQPNSVVTNALKFSMFSLFFRIFSASYTNKQAFSYGVDKQFPILVVNLISTGTFFVVAPFLIPKLKITGLALSIGIQDFIDFLGTEIIFATSKCFRRYNLFNLSNFKPDWKLLKKMVIVGLPVGGQTVLELLNIFGSAMIVGTTGEDSLVLWNVFSQYQLFLVAVSFAVAQFGGVNVSIKLGENDIRGAHKAVLITKLTGGALALGALVVVALFPNQLVSAYGITDPIKMSKAKKLLFIMALTNFFDVQRNIVTVAFKGLFDTCMPMVINGGVLTFFGLGVAGLTYFLVQPRDRIFAVALSQLGSFAFATLWLSTRLILKLIMSYNGRSQDQRILGNCISNFFKQSNKTALLSPTSPTNDDQEVPERPRSFVNRITCGVCTIM